MGKMFDDNADEDNAILWLVLVNLMLFMNILMMTRMMFMKRMHWDCYNVDCDNAYNYDKNFNACCVILILHVEKVGTHLIVSIEWFYEYDDETHNVDIRNVDINPLSMIHDGGDESLA